MRRLSAQLTVAAAAVWLAAGAVPVAAAQPSPTPEAPPPEAVPGEEVCPIGDPRLVELSGLVALEDGYAVVNDSSLSDDRVGVFLLDQGCQVTDQIGYPSPPLDPEDLAWDREHNVLWVGDIGDNFELTGQEPRPSAALWRIELDGDRTPVIHRFAYPDGPRDAEALLLDGEGTPIIVSKAVGAAELFVPTELRPSSGPDDLVPLEAAGEVTLPAPETEVTHRLGPAAREVVTGGANAPDGSAVVLRSYTDAFEFDVAEGDVVTALTTGQPRITPLPDEPQGEAIAYAPDGQRFLTVSEVPEDDDSGYTPLLLGYAPAAEPEPELTATGAPPAATGGGGGGGLFDDLQDIINVIAAVGVIGLLLVGAGVFGIIRARRGGAGGAAAGPGGGPGGGNAPVTGRARLPGFTAGAPPGAAGVAGVAGAAGVAGPSPGPGAESPASPSPGVYTSSTAARPPGTEYRGTEYGGGGGYQSGYGGPEADGDGYPAGEYDRGGGYGGADYRDQGYAGTDYGPTEPGPAGYGQPGYDQPGYDQSGYQQSGYQRGPAYGPAGYGPAGPAAGEHQDGPEGYPAGGYREPYDQDWPNGHAGGQPGGASHQPADDSGYYSDDPDYPYEFRGRDR